MSIDYFRNLSIRARIGMGYAFLTVILIGAVLVGISKVGEINVVSSRIADLVAPTAQESLKLLNGVNHSLAALRGWMILNNDKFRSDRAQAWSGEIEPSLARLKVLSASWENSGNIERLKEIDVRLVALKKAQQEIEEIAQTPENYPANKLLEEEALPKISTLSKEITNMIEIEKQLPATSERKALLGTMADIRGTAAWSSTAIRAYLLTGKKSDQEQYYQAWEENSKKLSILKSKVELLNPNQQRSFETFLEAREAFESLSQRLFDIRGSKEWNLGSAWLESKAAPFASAITADLKAIVEVQQNHMINDITVAKSLSTEVNQGGWWLLGIGMVVSLVLGTVLSRSISRPIQNGINALSSAAAELSTTATQLASNASETATSVNETTTTLEEVKQTSQVSNQKAEDVCRRSDKVMEILQSGSKSVQETLGGMNRIQTQMESIAESIVRLSEQSQSVGEIIATVNDLTEQSNLLAVNASIEAAKAADQGKGFAVVAQEIKSLADQSKQATAQIQTILNDIQKATSKAVMATEQGSKAVEEGVRQSRETGDSVSALTDSIREAAQAATQIGASAQQQLTGMSQVAQAMHSINQATQQTLAGTKQTEETAQNLNALGRQLKQLVEGMNHRYN